MNRRIILRTDLRIDDDDQLLLRFNNDADVDNALKVALTDAALYRELPGYEASGAVTVSVFLVSGIEEACILTAGTGRTVFGLARAGVLRTAGLPVFPTMVEENGLLLPLSDRHADVVVCAYPASAPAYTGSTPRLDRKALRQDLRAAYAAALRMFDPRHLTSSGPAQPDPSQPSLEA